ncbi:four helix bundle protein [Crocosphaera sp. UHCC 0190]|uniref:four helix bundle protein n=1 Tax=Crocosphaera sp. UHCC 0190 TaxID=3110246 RepID=UPI002B1FD5EC|nr:four helix bundle protein [Crocosphaera sp. UHCC 0190]MEA5510653.1 four helix bundle protein [Crocosphaera sp. UHCC 0190]
MRNFRELKVWEKAHQLTLSVSELEYHLLLAYDLKLLEAKNDESLSSKVTEIKRMLTAFIQKLNTER